MQEPPAVFDTAGGSFIVRKRCYVRFYVRGNRALIISVT